MKTTRKEPLIAVDFFCCAGGVTCGFRKAGINVLAGIDIEGSYRESYEINNPGSKFLEKDIASLQPSDLEIELDIKPNMDNLILVGCSLCQYYTTIHTDKTQSSKGKLLLEEFKRFVDYFNPGFIFIENVPGLDRKPGSPLSDFKTFLEDRKYSFDDNVINAANYDVPQNRLRYVLVASRINKTISIPKGNNNTLTIKKAIGKFKSIEAGHRDKNTNRKHWSAALKAINLKRIRSTSHNGGTRLEWKDDPELQLNCYKNKDGTFPDVYGRLRWDRPSPTITTKFYSLSNGRFGHPVQDRGLSLREGAKLQSFPNNYQFVSESQIMVARMIGNAVPPNMARWIGGSIKKAYSRATIQSKSQSN